MDFLPQAIGQMNNLVQGVATAAGRVMSLATVGSHHVWLGLTALHGKDREELLGALISSDGLFGSISSATPRFRRLEEEKAQLSRHLPLAHGKGSELRRCNATLRRRARRQARSPLSSSPATQGGSTDAPRPPRDIPHRRGDLHRGQRSSLDPPASLPVAGGRSGR